MTDTPHSLKCGYIKPRNRKHWFHKRRYDMKLNKQAILAVLFLLSMISMAWGTLLFEENFDYTVGALSLTTTGWTAHSGTTFPFTVVNPGLDYPGYASSNIGNTVQTGGGSGYDINKNFTTPVTSGSVYGSFLINMSSFQNTTQDYAIHFGTANGGATFNTRVYLQSNGTNVRFGISKQATNTTVIKWTGGLFTGGTFDYALNTTYLVVMKYEYVAGGTSNDIASLWINPIAASQATPTLTIGSEEGTGSTDLTTISSFCLRQSANTPWVCKYDGIRIGTTWADLFPTNLNPTLTVLGSLEPFAAFVGAPSASQSFNLHGTDLTENITVHPPQSFEVATSSSGPWSNFMNPLILAPSFNGDIFVQFVPVSAGPVNNSISISSGTAPVVTVAVSGEGTQPAGIISADVTNLTFSTVAGTPSGIQQYTLSGTDLSNFLYVTTSAPFQIRSSAGGAWGTYLELAPDYNDIMEVRYNPSVTGTDTGTILHYSDFAADVNISLNGAAADPTPVITVTPNTLSFSTNAGTPSAAQSVTLSGANLTASINIDSAQPYLFSTTEAGTYTSTLSVAASYNGLIWIKFNPSTGATGFYNAPITFTSGAATANITMTSNALDPNSIYATDLLISEYVEGTSNKKAIEIFNGTGVTVDLANYTLKKQINGAGAFVSDLVLSGSLPNNDVYVIVLSSTSGTNLAGNSWVDLATTSSALSFNGNDAVALFHGTTQVDQVGIFNQVTPNWGTDLTLVRKPNISTPTTAFSFTDWDQYAMDTITYLGNHTFTPGVSVAEAPVLAPAAGIQVAPISVTISTTTPSASIYYTTNGDTPTDLSTLYTGGIPVSSTTTIKAITYATGFTPSSVTTATYVYPVNVANIAALRAAGAGTTVYRVTGEAYITLKSASRNSKYVQDASGAVLIDDLAGVMPNASYNIGDGLTNLVGTLADYFGMLQFTPLASPGAATSTGHVTTPIDVTLAALTSADQAKLVRISGVSVTGTGLFVGSPATNYPITDATGTGVLRTSYFDLDYIGTAIPATAKDYVGVIVQYTAGTPAVTTMQLVPRSLAEITDSTPPSTPINVTVTVVGNDIQLSWDAAANATGYIVQYCDTPGGTYTQLGTSATAGYVATGDAATYGKRFYKVIATN